VTMRLTDHPDHVVRHEPPACRKCGTGLKDAKIAELQERVERLERLISRNSLLTEQGPVFPQLDRLAVTPGLYRHRSWLGSGIGILRRWWCRCRVRWWRPGTGMSRSGWSGLTEWQRNR